MPILKQINYRANLIIKKLNKRKKKKKKILQKNARFSYVYDDNLFTSLPIRPSSSSAFVPPPPFTPPPPLTPIPPPTTPISPSSSCSLDSYRSNLIPHHEINVTNNINEDKDDDEVGNVNDVDNDDDDDTVPVAAYHNAVNEFNDVRVDNDFTEREEDRESIKVNDDDECELETVCPDNIKTLHDLSLWNDEEYHQHDKYR